MKDQLTKTMKTAFTLFFTLLFLTVFSQKKDKFQPGYYYDNSGNKVSGLIYYRYDYKVPFRFKADENSKSKNIDPSDAKAFVVGTDSFTVLRNFYMEGLGGGSNFIRVDFVKVTATGKVTLYEDYSTQGSAGSSFYGGGSTDLTNFILQRENGNLITVKHKNKKKFLSQMKNFFSDDAEILKGLEEGLYRYEDIPKMVSLYNSRL